MPTNANLYAGFAQQNQCKITFYFIILLALDLLRTVQWSVSNVNVSFAAIQIYNSFTATQRVPKFWSPFTQLLNAIEFFYSSKE